MIPIRQAGCTEARVCSRRSQVQDEDDVTLSRTESQEAMHPGKLEINFEEMMKIKEEGERKKKEEERRMKMEREKKEFEQLRQEMGVVRTLSPLGHFLDTFKYFFLY